MKFTLVVASAALCASGALAFNHGFFRGMSANGKLTIMSNGIGAGGMADTRDPEPFINDSDPRQSISAAPSFEEYLKSRGMAAATTATPAPAPATPAPAPVAAAPAPVAAAPTSVSSPTPVAAGSTSDPIFSLQASQTAMVDKIAAAIPDLAPKPDLSWAAADGVTVGGNPATLDGRDAPGNSNIAWLASVNVANQMSSLTIFNGPLTDVPHLVSRCIVNADNTMSLTLDFRPRAYGAYEMVDADGNYPGPEKLGRDAFTYSGNRKEFEKKFGTEEVVAFMKSTAASFEGSSPIAAQSESESLTTGPLAIKVTMPVTGGNVAAVNAAREQAAQYWLTWALEDSHYHKPGAPINSQYVYDSKYRQDAYSALLSTYSAAFGADGPKVTAAESGPLDEAYVGGGS